ncbi:hypothetical protein [Streptomyces sp. NPDC057238]|uniref:hypothetical protein n=1 Tax=Streptomyces sp. NPDC057238 TaxID=3346060 RepID=UPI0036261D8C
MEPSALRMRDLCAEAAAGILQRPARSLLAAVGTVLGVGSFVAVLGLTATASSRIDNRFNELSATEGIVEDSARQRNECVDVASPDDADARHPAGDRHGGTARGAGRRPVGRSVSGGQGGADRAGGGAATLT